MNKTKYSRSDECKLLTLPEAVETFNLSASTVEKLARQSGAKLKIGRSARYRKDILQAHIDTFRVV